jgi:Flp pilus assembly pilin Flp
MGRRSADGQGLVEYALIIVLVAVVCVVALTAFGTATGAAIQSIVGSL